MSGIVLLLIRLTMTLALYAFLGWAIMILWRTLRQQKELEEARQISSITLINQTDAGLASRQFLQRDIIIGRNQTCDFLIEDQIVSAEHARLSYHHNHWWVEDLQSTNGTFLNQERLISPAVLTSGDQIQIGQVTLKVQMEG
jgi:pSer/pThr/pTyr-binding forkhead associated (FHA) protein